MRIVEPSHQFETPIAGKAGREMIHRIEAAARTCYQSECGGTSEFVRKIARVKKHHSVLEHASVTVRFVCDRGVSHELVRHRLASFSQESTRYCNYSKGKFGSQLTFVRPPFWEQGSPKFRIWFTMCACAELEYLNLLERGAKPEEARSILPNSLKTEIVMTANLREWSHIFDLRCAPTAHPQMRQLMRPVQAEFAKHLPEIFDPPVDAVCATPDKPTLCATPTTSTTSATADAPLKPQSPWWVRLWPRGLFSWLQTGITS
jgi:thymidylate synthase (FAD)